MKALPYVIFLVVPVLGRMSDSDDAIRSTATNTFASLVKMVPLEVSFTVFGCFATAQSLLRLVYLIPLGSLKICSSAVMMKGNSLHNCWTAPKSSSTTYLSRSTPNYARTNKMALTGLHFWPSISFMAFFVMVGLPPTFSMSSSVLIILL